MNEESEEFLEELNSLDVEEEDVVENTSKPSNVYVKEQPTTQKRKIDIKKARNARNNTKPKTKIINYKKMSWKDRFGNAKAEIMRNPLELVRNLGIIVCAIIILYVYVYMM